MDDLERVLKTHPFLEGLGEAHVQLLVGCAKNVRFRVGEYLMREGEHEDSLYLLRQGSVSIELPATGGAAAVLETVGAGDIVGVSCMTPRPAHLDCRARETVIAFALDNRCLQEKMRADPALGFAITTRLLERTYERLSHARLQNLDVYR
jgi:CRP-like cAMP-binding protein